MFGREFISAHEKAPLCAHRPRESDKQSIFGRAFRRDAGRETVTPIIVAF